MRKPIGRCAFLLAFLGSSTLVVSGCGNGDNTGGPDADHHNYWDSQVSNNTNQNQNQNTNTNTNTNTGSCDQNLFGGTMEFASTRDYGMAYDAYTSESAPYDMLTVRIYTDWGGPTAPGTYSLDGINFRDCGLCLLILAGCGTTECDKIFYADAGSVNITSIGGIGSTFAGTLQNVVFKEVTIDESTFVSTPVPNGETWCLNGYQYSETVEDENAGICGQAGVTCVGETMSDFSLQNCETEQMVSMSSLAAGNKAMWFVATHGWCSACHSWVPQVVSAYDADHANGLQTIIVLGEDSGHGQPTLAECRSYAASYDSDATLFFLDHNGQDSHATLFDHLWPYPDEQGMLGFPWNGVVNAQTMEYEYADGAGGDLNTTLNQLLQ